MKQEEKFENALKQSAKYLAEQFRYKEQYYDLQDAQRHFVIERQAMANALKACFPKKELDSIDFRLFSLTRAETTKDDGDPMSVKAW